MRICTFRMNDEISRPTERSYTPDEVLAETAADLRVDLAGLSEAFIQQLHEESSEAMDEHAARRASGRGVRNPASTLTAGFHLARDRVAKMLAPYVSAQRQRALHQPQQAGSSNLSPYEDLRQRNVDQNKRVLESLGLA